jgi:hypothetical protein
MTRRDLADACARSDHSSDGQELATAPTLSCPFCGHSTHYDPAVEDYRHCDGSACWQTPATETPGA